MASKTWEIAKEQPLQTFVDTRLADTSLWNLKELESRKLNRKVWRY